MKKTRRNLKKQRKTKSKRGGGPKSQKQTPKQLTREEKIEHMKRMAHNIVERAEASVSDFKTSHDRVFTDIMKKIGVNKSSSGSISEEDERNTIRKLKTLEFDLSEENIRKFNQLRADMISFFNQCNDTYENVRRENDVLGLTQLNERLKNAIDWVNKKIVIYNLIKKFINDKNQLPPAPPARETDATASTGDIGSTDDTGATAMPPLLPP